MKEDATEALVFQDEVEIHRHPTLTRMWAPVGTQPEVPAPGQNEKKVVYQSVEKLRFAPMKRLYCQAFHWKIQAEPHFSTDCYGGIDYATGKIIHTVAATKSGFNFLAFLIALARAYAGRKVRLVCDNGSFHYTKPVAAWLEANRDKVEIFWLPPYCPSLNLIERLWGHLKRTVLANVLFKDMDDLTAAFERGVKRINGHREKMAFIFDHDDILKKTG